MRTLANTNIKEYMKELADGNDLIECWSDYNSGYVCDIISEIADSNVSIYTQEQFDYAVENDDAVEEAFFNGIAPDGAEFFKNNRGGFREYVAAVGAAAWYEHNTIDMYNNMDECIVYAICEALRTQYDITELTEVQVDMLEDHSFDNNDRLEDIIEEVAKELSSTNEEEEED